MSKKGGRLFFLSTAASDDELRRAAKHVGREARTLSLLRGHRDCEREGTSSASTYAPSSDVRLRRKGWEKKTEGGDAKKEK